RHLRGQDCRRVPADRHRGRARVRDDRGEKGDGRLTTDVQQIPTGPPDEPESDSLVARYSLLQKAEGLIAPLLTLALAFLISGVVVLLTTGSIRDTLKTYQAIFRGAG